MARSARPSRPAPADDGAPAPAADVDDPQWAAFLERVSAVEDRDPDEPGRWERFWARLRSVLGPTDDQICG